MSNFNSERVAFTLWSIYSALTLGVMLAHESASPQVLDRYSLNYALLLAAAAGIYGISALYALSASARQLITGQLTSLRQSALTCWIGWALLSGGAGAFWLFAPVSSAEAGPLFFRLYVVVSLFVLSLWWLRGAQGGAAAEWRPAYWAWLVLALAVALTTAYRSRVQPPQLFHEDMIAAYAINWVQTGDPTQAPTMLFETPFLFTSLSAYALGLWLSWFGVTFDSARLWAVACGLAALLAVLLTFARRSHAYRWALILAAAFGSLVLLGGNMVRFDAFSPVILGLALWALFAAHDNSRWRWLLYAAAGFLLSATIEGHQLAIRFGIAAGVLYLVIALWAHLRSRRADLVPAVSLAAGALIYSAVYAASRMILWQTDLNGLFDYISAAYSVEAQIGGMSTLLDRVVTPLRDWIIIYISNHTAVLLALLLATALALLVNDRALRLAVALFWLSEAALLIINPKPNAIITYITHTLPLFAATAYLSWRALAQVQGQHLALGAAGFILIVGTAQPLYNARSIGAQELLDAGVAINARLPAAITVVSGMEPLWWGLHERTFYIAQANFGLMRVEDLPARFGVKPVEAFVVTEHVQDQLVPNVTAYIASANMQRSFCLPSAEFGQIAVYVLPHFPHENGVGCAP